MERFGSSWLMVESGSWAFDLVAAGSSVDSTVGRSRLDWVARKEVLHLNLMIFFQRLLHLDPSAKLVRCCSGEAPSELGYSRNWSIQIGWWLVEIDLNQTFESLVMKVADLLWLMGLNVWAETAQAPSPWPQRVTRLGSPPKLRISVFTQRRAWT